VLLLDSRQLALYGDTNALLTARRRLRLSINSWAVWGVTNDFGEADGEKLEAVLDSMRRIRKLCSTAELHVTASPSHANAKAAASTPSAASAVDWGAAADGTRNPVAGGHAADGEQDADTDEDSHDEARHHRTAPLRAADAADAHARCRTTGSPAQPRNPPHPPTPLPVPLLWHGFPARRLARRTRPSRKGTSWCWSLTRFVGCGWWAAGCWRLALLCCRRLALEAALDPPTNHRQPPTNDPAGGPDGSL
jgi:hypothetical protein